MSADQRPGSRERADRPRPEARPRPADDAGGEGTTPKPAAMSHGADDEGDTPARRARQEAWRGLDQGSIMSVELITATLVWFGIGWLLDRLLGTDPWLMFAGALLGNWAGLYLIWIRGQRNEADEIARRERSRPPAPVVPGGLPSPPPRALIERGAGEPTKDATR